MREAIAAPKIPTGLQGCIQNWQVLGCMCLALALKLALAYYTRGTNDVTTWEYDVRKLTTEGFAALYRNGVQYPKADGKLCFPQLFIHPPAILHFLRGLGIIERVSALPLRFWMRAACAAADAGTVLLVATLGSSRPSKTALIILVLSPVSILISGFHGNTDPLMVFFLLLAVWLVERGRPSLAGVAFGVSAGFKVVPVLLAPVFLLYLRTNRSRCRWISSAAAVWLLGALPYLAEEPGLITRTILGYSSSVGLYGFHFLLEMLNEIGIGFPIGWYAPIEKWVALLSAGALPFFIRARQKQPSLFVQCGAAVFLFLFLSPGFAVQYLAWTVPWIIALGVGNELGYYCATGISLLAIYLEAGRGHGVPLYADFFSPLVMRPINGWVCWIAFGVVTYRYLRVINDARRSVPNATGTSGPSLRNN